jgi:hypothetical protein
VSRRWTNRQGHPFLDESLDGAPVVEALRDAGASTVCLWRAPDLDSHRLEHREGAGQRLAARAAILEQGFTAWG